MADLSSIPFLYKLFFLYIEPVSTIVGAFYAWFQPLTYLDLTHAESAPVLGLPIGTHVVLRQLGNLYLAFTLNEALVLRATNDLKVWRMLLVGLLIADFGHLYSCYPLGLSYYYDFVSWNSIAWGNIAFVYCGAATRISFLLGLGLGGGRKAKAKVKKSVKIAKEELGPASPSQGSKQLSGQTPKRRKAKSSGT